MAGWNQFSLASLAFKFGMTQASKTLVLLVDRASAAVLAESIDTFAVELVAVNAGSPAGTVALVARSGSDNFGTGDLLPCFKTVIKTGIGIAKMHITFTMGTSFTVRTDADVPVDHISTKSVGRTRLRMTLVDIYATGSSSPARLALAVRKVVKG